MKRSEGIAYLVRCSDDNGRHFSGGVEYAREDCYTCNGTNDAGWLRTPCSRYGRTAAEVAPKVWRAAVEYRRAAGEPITYELLDSFMSRAVNDRSPIAGCW